MENVYVIKVKTKPALSSLYPSERRYSASTVGGLALVHFGLGALSLLLGTLALSVQGAILSIACLVPFVAGLLAWRRWYIDRNITIFFSANLFSLLAAILCLVVTILDIAAVAETNNGSLWSMEKILRGSSDTFVIDNNNNNNNNSNNVTALVEETTMKIEKFVNESDKGLSYDDLKGESSILYERSMSISGNALEKESENKSKEELVSLDRDKVLSLWQKDRIGESSQTETLLTVNVLVASLLEVFWSLLSAKIALRGMMNRFPDIDHGNNFTDTDSKRVASTGHRRKHPPPPRPDILDHDRGSSESALNINSMSSVQTAAPNPALPLPESSREFRERVERFLANQAALRIVEGSCT
ncbi:uncharacterized protein LOC122627178 [Vespula pensylvanica]|uniref:Uncharacterized protein n=1 Tax=Vespula pensylvanica TaxID=30213 RepID=A0A834P969_VESPE|nr:uncharacterized protein LOC122627178 [Vespula pensylvanica]KAF7433900.1 hypothetical protein H0235_002091 [Vespula pensylvanica]